MGNVKLLYFFIFMIVFFSYSMNLMQSSMKKYTDTFPNTAEEVYENLMQHCKTLMLLVMKYSFLLISHTINHKTNQKSQIPLEVFKIYVKRF